MFCSLCRDIFLAGGLVTGVVMVGRLLSAGLSRAPLSLCYWLGVGRARLLSGAESVAALWPNLESGVAQAALRRRAESL